MWITVSKNSDADAKKLACSLAGALPLFKFVPRGKLPLSRLDRLAQRDGETAYLVLGKSGKDCSSMLMSRHYVDDGDTCVWMWRHFRLEGLEAKCAALGEYDEPFELQWKESEANTRLAEFFGYSKGKTKVEYEESCRIELDATSKSLKIKVDGKMVAELKYTIHELDGKEED